MRILSLSLLASLSLVAAKISGLEPYTQVYHAGKHTKFPLTFRAVGSPITADDYSAAVGIRSATEPFPGDNALGRFFYNVDLFALGHYRSPPGTFTVDIPLPASEFYAGSGNYVITTSVTSAFGIFYFTQVRSFNITIQATV